MKSVILFACFFFVSMSLFAQTVADAGTLPEMKPLTYSETKITATTVAAHNKMAFTQIGEYLNENLEYPTDMTEYALEGTVTAAIILSDAGQIAKVIIAKSELPKPFQQQLTKTLLSLKQLELKHTDYYGDNVLYVPVRFSL